MISDRPSGRPQPLAAPGWQGVNRRISSLQIGMDRNAIAYATQQYQNFQHQACVMTPLPPIAEDGNHGHVINPASARVEGPSPSNASVSSSTL
eukprot:905403-Amphidinium_carterae.2